MPIERRTLPEHVQRKLPPSKLKQLKDAHMTAMAHLHKPGPRFFPITCMRVHSSPPVKVREVPTTHPHASLVAASHLGPPLACVPAARPPCKLKGVTNIPDVHVSVRVESLPQAHGGLLCARPLRALLPKTRVSTLPAEVARLCAPVECLCRPKRHLCQSGQQQARHQA